MAITFDGPSKLMTLTSGTTSVSVRELWSRWVDWCLTGDNSKYLFAFQSIGGDPVTSEISIPIYAFLLNGWRIKPQEANHTLVVGDGILVVDGGGDPFVNTSGSYVVRINYQQPVQAITVATGGSGITVNDIVEGVWGESLPGTYGSGEAGKIIGDNVDGKISDIPTTSEITTAVITTEDTIDTGVSLGEAIKSILDTLAALDIPIPPSVSEIVDGVLNTEDSIEVGRDLGESIRDLLNLIPSDTEQAGRLADLFKRFGLDVSTPVVHTEGGITAGDIAIEITEEPAGTFTEQRQ